MLRARPVRDFFIQTNEEFEGEYTMANGKKLILTSVTEDAFQQKKSAKVIAIPLINGLKEISVGDEIFFKHTILRHMWVEENRRELSQFLINLDKGIFRVPGEHIWAYLTKEGEFNVTDEWVVVAPSKIEDEVRPSGVIMPGFDKEIEQIGTITHIGKNLKDAGYEIGDTVIWSENSEYEVKIDQEKRYRMHHEWIIGKYEC